MKRVLVYLEESEYNELWKKKGKFTWKQWLLREDLIELETEH